ncbi:mevalonate kinase [Chrysoperla carnea]|uniref:mevalonate kinase n=1 Tax=Chrysoperla carnea TaxID=189513 RepID=UPI001D0763D9|nr:mevalonate kinase [Chrysoperla carnea]
MGKEIIVSAPGKIILHGEHSVVYHKVAIAASLNRRTTIKLKIQDNDDQLIKLLLPDVNIENVFNLTQLQKLFETMPLKSTEFTINTPNMIDFPKFLEQITNYLENSIQTYNSLTNAQRMALIAFLYLFIGILRNSTLNSIEILVISDLKISSGTGSSASYCTALAAAFLVYKQNLTSITGEELNIINAWATFGEQIMHGGASSGIDTAICTYGSLVKFRKGDPIEQIHLQQSFRIMLIDTLIPRDTKKMVQKLCDLRKKLPTVVDPILNSMEAIALEALQCIQTNSNYDNLRELMNINQALLCALNVSHETLDEICKIAKKYNLGGKLTGAGGGGYAIILLPPTLKNDVEMNLICDLESLKFNVLTTFIGGSGVQIDKIIIN